MRLLQDGHPKGGAIARTHVAAGKMQSHSGKRTEGKWRSWQKSYMMLARKQEAIGRDLGKCVFTIPQKNGDQTANEHVLIVDWGLNWDYCNKTTGCVRSDFTLTQRGLQMNT